MTDRHGESAGPRGLSFAPQPIAPSAPKPRKHVRPRKSDNPDKSETGGATVETPRFAAAADPFPYVAAPIANTTPAGTTPALQVNGKISKADIDSDWRKRKPKPSKEPPKEPSMGKEKKGGRTVPVPASTPVRDAGTPGSTDTDSSRSRGRGGSMRGKAGRRPGSARDTGHWQLPEHLAADHLIKRGPHGRLLIVHSDGTQVDMSLFDSGAQQGRQTKTRTPSPEHVQSAMSRLAIDDAAPLAQPIDSAPIPSTATPSKTHLSGAARTPMTGSPRTAIAGSPRGQGAYFEEHVPVETALRGVEDGSYYKGTLRISPKSRNDAWITVVSKSFNDDILLEGDAARNRALNGDEVAVQIVSRPSDNTDVRFADRCKGKVVCVLERRPLERISGLLKPPNYVHGQGELTDRQAIARAGSNKFAMFIPQDNRIPFMEVHESDLPDELRGPNLAFNVLAKRKTIYAARLKMWVPDYWRAQRRYPRGAIVAELGGVGEIEAETAAILADCDVDTREHPPKALACLPEVPWRVSEEEVAKRRDFRSTRVVTIDPETARDLDDALSVRPLGDGRWEIGVHIADVSHFVAPQTALDDIAQSRATTVYMVQRAVPMLPRLLCEELCSLNPAVDRLAFSVTWTMDADGNEVGPRWYGRSIIRSCVRFAYAQAQAVLDGAPWQEAVGKPVDGGHTIDDVTSDLTVLLRMSKAMRARRYDNGALTINAFKLNFRLDRDGLPKVAEVYELKDTNRLIEEFMLKANISVAERITDAFPKHALLRMHPPPKDRPLQMFVEYARKLGIEVDASSSAGLQKSFLALAERSKDDPVVAVLQNNAVRSMRRAEYICTGLHDDDPTTWAHYALAVPLYTHFTSPIRRYADVVVHRLLQAALDAGDAGFAPEECEAWAKTCNVRKENARTAQDRSSMLYLCSWIEETCRRTGALGTDEGMEMDAIVVSLLDRSVDVVVPAIALDKRIYYDGPSIARYVHHPGDDSVDLHWRSRAERKAEIARLDGTAQRKHELATRRAARQGEIAGTMRENAVPVEAIDEADVPGTTTTLRSLDRIKVWVRGDFSTSPCQVLVGFVSPSK